MSSQVKRSWSKMEIEEKGRVDELIIIGRGAITIRE